MSTPVFAIHGNHDDPAGVRLTYVRTYVYHACSTIMYMLYVHVVYLNNVQGLTEYCAYMEECNSHHLDYSAIELYIYILTYVCTCCMFGVCMYVRTCVHAWPLVLK